MAGDLSRPASVHLSLPPRRTPFARLLPRVRDHRRYPPTSVNYFSKCPGGPWVRRTSLSSASIFFFFPRSALDGFEKSTLDCGGKVPITVNSHRGLFFFFFFFFPSIVLIPVRKTSSGSFTARAALGPSPIRGDTAPSSVFSRCSRYGHFTRADPVLSFMDKWSLLQLQFKGPHSTTVERVYRFLVRPPPPPPSANVFCLRLI